MKGTIIIIGAGAAGLMAARELSAAGYPVLLLEGAERTGGRIYTIEAQGFEQPIEMGAEFMHGRLPLTIGLLEEAGISYEKTSGRMIQMRKGEWKQQEDFTIDWVLLLQRLYELKERCAPVRFSSTNISGEKNMPLFVLLSAVLQKVLM